MAGTGGRLPLVAVFPKPLCYVRLHPAQVVTKPKDIALAFEHIEREPSTPSIAPVEIGFAFDFGEMFPQLNDSVAEH